MYPPPLTARKLARGKTQAYHKALCLLQFTCLLMAGLLPSESPMASPIAKSKNTLQVVVNSAYINVYTGPGRGYPISHALEKGETITLIKSKNDWIKVSTEKGLKGWINRRAMDSTVGVNGEIVRLSIPKRDDYSQRHWEIGVSFGEFENIPSIGIHGAYRLTPNISAELRYTQATGRSSNSKLYSWGLMHQPFPEWRLSPFFTLANGELEISPNSNLSQAQDQQDTFFMVGVGTYFYLTHRFMFRFEYNNYTTLPDRDSNENIDEWKLGLSAFF